MTTQLKIGIIGTSAWTDSMYLSALTTYNRAALWAICGRNRGRADEMATKHSIPHVYTDYREMIASAGLEAIVIASPDDQHYDMVLAALEAGLHVLCEKPLALNAEQAKIMADRATAAGVKHLLYHTFRWVPSFRYVKQLVEENTVGPIQHATLRYSAGYGRSSRYLWRFDGDRANGILGDLGSHMIDLARWYLGDITSVNASITNHYDRYHDDGSLVTPANDYAALQLSFASGARANIEVSAVAHMAERNMHQVTALYGVAGTLENDFWLAQPDFSLRLAHSDDQQFRRLPIPGDLLAGITTDNPFGNFVTQSVGSRYFVDCVLDNKKPAPDFQDEYQIQRVIDAALESQRTGRRITLEA